MRLRQVEREVGLDEPAQTHERPVVGAPVARVEHDGATAQAEAAAPDALALAERIGRAATDRTSQAGEGAHRVWAHRAVGFEPDARLERANGLVGGRAVDAVDLAGSEPELDQSALQGSDVITLDQVSGQVPQYPVTE